MSRADATAPTLLADYFDGHSSQAWPVRLRVHQRVLHIDGVGAGDGAGGVTDGGTDNGVDNSAIALRVPVRQVSWPERQRHGARQAYLPHHGLISHADADAWDAWASASGVRTSLLVHAMQSWRGALLGMLLLLATLWGGWLWGVPVLGRGIVALVPVTADAQLGAASLASLDRDWLQPSRLPPDTQARVRRLWDVALARWAATPGTPPLPAWTLQFRHMPARPGQASSQAGTADGPAAAADDPGLANALALPGGTLIVTDALVRLLDDRPDVLVGVLGHELGHVQHRHGMRALAQAGLLAAASSLVLGDVSAVLAAVPVLLGQAAYSRQFEFQADAEAAAMLRANGHDPAVLGVLFDRLRRAAPAAGTDLPVWGIGLASHPPDAERMRRMTGTR